MSDSNAAAMTVVEAALAVIVDPEGRHVVISLRKGETHLGGFWEFPGGKLEAQESARDCAVREAFEEVGLAVEIVDSLAVIEFSYRDKAVKLHPFLCRSAMTNVVANASEDAKWVPIAELGQYRFPPANDAIIELLQSKFAQVAGDDT